MIIVLDTLKTVEVDVTITLQQYLKFATRDCPPNYLLHLFSFDKLPRAIYLLPKGRWNAGKARIVADAVKKLDGHFMLVGRRVATAWGLRWPVGTNSPSVFLYPHPKDHLWDDPIESELMIETFLEWHDQYVA